MFLFQIIITPNQGYIATQRSPKSGYRMTSKVLYHVVYNAQYHRQHCTLQAFEQFGTLYNTNTFNYNCSLQIKISRYVILALYGALQSVSTVLS